MSIVCNLWGKYVAGKLHYRATVEADGRTVFTGPWRASKQHAHAEAERAARAYAVNSGQRQKTFPAAIRPLRPI